MVRNVILMVQISLSFCILHEVCEPSNIPAYEGPENMMIIAIVIINDSFWHLFTPD